MSGISSISATNHNGLAANAKTGTWPLANIHIVTTSYAVQIGKPLANVQKTLSLVWPPHEKYLLVAAGRRSLNLKRVPWLLRTYRRQWNRPNQIPMITAL